jgi:hypothetical protein
VGEVTINGTVGEKLKDATIEITVDNGTFDPVALYEGKDITEYFRPYDYQMTTNSNGDRSSEGTYFREDSGISQNDGLYRTYYYAPAGITISVAECTETKLVCTVSGTPLSPSTKNIEVRLLPEMFATRNPQAINNSNNSVSFSTNGKWNITSSENGSTSATLTCDTNNITGTAGQTELSTQFTITLKKAVFALDLPAGTDVSVWFSGAKGDDGWTNQLPVDVTALIASDVKMGDKTCTVKLSGTPRYGNNSSLCPMIPAQYVVRPKSNSSVFWQNYPIIGTSNVKFSISGLENEEPYMVANSADLYMYPMPYNQSGDGTWDSPGAARTYFCIYNGFFSGKESLIDSAIKGLTDRWVFSNQKGNTDTTSAEGFLYSPGGASGTEDHLDILTFRAAAYYQNTGNTATETQLKSQKKFYLSIKGTPYTVGEYPLSFFVPKNLLIDMSGEEGYTTVVIDKIPEKQGKLVIMNPLQLVFDNAQLQYKKGEVVNDYITLKKSVYSRYIMKSSVTAENLKYTVSDEFKELGLNLEPVKVTPRSIIFHVTGTIKVKKAEFDLKDAVSISYENFDGTKLDRFVEADINSNPDAKIVVGDEGYGIAGNEIDYSEREPVKVYAKIKGTNTVSGGAINLSGIDGPTLETTVAYKCYSTDGGTKWKEAKSALSAKQIAAMVNKGMTFMIADSYDKKAKGPAEGANIYEFAEIVKQEKGPKFKIDYTTWADSTGESTGQFILIGVASDKTETSYNATYLRNTFEIGIVSGKGLNEDGYGVWPVKGGLTIGAVEKSGTKEKVVKNVYYIRTAPYLGNDGKYVPAGKPVKVSVSGQQKAPNVKIDYKKEVLKGKENLSVSADDVQIVTRMSKEDAKTPIDISSYLQVGVQTEIKVWIAASEKKPASSVQIIPAAARAAAVTSGAITFNASKHTVTLSKDYEVYDAEKQKWGGVPKITDAGNHTFRIRRKADAKGGKETESYTAYAAGEEMNLVIVYGEYTSGKSTKNGILSAEIQIK